MSEQDNRAHALVCPQDGAKALPPMPVHRTYAALKQQRYRLRKQHEASGEAWLFTECRECGKPIKPSYKRGFCPGGKCKSTHSKRVQVRTWMPISLSASAISQRAALLKAPKALGLAHA